MDVQGAEPRQVDHRFRQDVPVRDDHAHVGREGTQLAEELVALRLLRLQHGNPFAERYFLHGRSAHRGSRAADGLVGLRHDGDDLEPLAEQRTQRRRRELGRAPEEHAHATAPLPGACAARAPPASRARCGG